MPKTCRTCGFAALARECNLRHIWVGDTELCGDHKPREKPLLVDALATTAELLLEKMDNIGDGMLFNLDILEARDTLRKSLARYKEEVGDDEETE